MKANEFVSMSKDQLTAKVAELKKELFTLRFQLATGQLQNTMQKIVNDNNGGLVCIII